MCTQKWRNIAPWHALSNHGHTCPASCSISASWHSMSSQPRILRKKFTFLGRETTKFWETGTDHWRESQNTTCTWLLLNESPETNTSERKWEQSLT